MVGTEPNHEVRPTAVLFPNADPLPIATITQSPSLTRLQHDPRWTKMDHYAVAHLQPPSQPYNSALAFAAAHAEANKLPDIAVSALQGQFLALQCKLINAKHILEVGTLGGYSTIWLASIAPDVRVTSVEVDERHARVAREAIEHAGLGGRVEIVVGAGREVLPRLRGEVQGGKREKWDFVFVDADKESNWFYLNECVLMTRGNGLIVVDNVVRRGLTADAERAKTDSRVAGSREVIEKAGADERIEVGLLQTVGEKNYDGFIMCRVK